MSGSVPVMLLHRGHLADVSGDNLISAWLCPDPDWLRLPRSSPQALCNIRIHEKPVR